MAIHIGHERAGWKGLIVGFCFIVPAVLITGIFAFYKDYGQLPAIQPFIRYKTSHNCHYFRAIFPLAKKSLKQFN
jgi:chromate transporter